MKVCDSDCGDQPLSADQLLQSVKALGERVALLPLIHAAQENGSHAFLTGTDPRMVSVR
jgi:hypothetical protein